MTIAKVVTIACWLIAATVLIGLAIWFLTGTVFGIGSDIWSGGILSGISIGSWEVLTGSYNVVGTYNVETTGVSSLKIDWISNDVTVKPYDGDKIQITEFAQRELRDNEKLHLSTSGKTLTIKFFENGKIGRMPRKKLEVLIPHTLSGEIDNLSVDSVSGTLLVEGIDANTINVDTTSGSIQMSNITAQAFGAESTSGAITITYTRSGNMKVESISGAIRVSDSSARTLNCDTTSGSVNVSGAYESTRFHSISGRLSLDNQASGSILDAETTSGSMEMSGAFDRVITESISGKISVKSRIVPEALKAETTSGSIDVTVPDEGTITVYHSAVSGRFSSDVSVIMQGRGAQFEFSSISGSTKILAL